MLLTVNYIHPWAGDGFHVAGYIFCPRSLNKEHLSVSPTGLPVPVNLKVNCYTERASGLYSG